MYIKRNILFILYLILFIFAFYLISSTSYLKNIDGKFAMESIRNKEGIYLYENNSLRFLISNFSCPKWSKDGKILGCINSNKICFLDSKDYKIIKTIKFSDMQVTSFVWGDSFLIVSIRFFRDGFYHYKIVKYDIKNNSYHSLIKFLFKNSFFEIKNMCLSRDDKYLSFSSGSDTFNSYLCLLNIDSFKIYYLWENAYPIGWNSIDLLFFSNSDRKYNVSNDRFSSILKINAKTFKISTIQKFVYTYSSNIKLTRDGKYIYYSISSKKGSYIVFSKLNGDNLTIVTKPFFINKKKVYSRDIEPDWFFNS